MTVNKYDGTAFSEVPQVGQSEGSTFSDSEVKVRRSDGTWDTIWPSTVTQIYRDFDDGTVGQQPSDTTIRRNATSDDWLVQDVNSRRVLQYNNDDSTTPSAISYDELLSSGVVEIYALVNDQMRFIMFATDGPDNEYGFINTGSTAKVYKRVDGSYTELADAPDSTSSDYAKVRCQVDPGSPNTLRMRIWNESDPEPSSWDAELTDDEFDIVNGPQADGWVGHLLFRSSMAINIDAIGIGIDGDPAPTS